MEEAALAISMRDQGVSFNEIACVLNKKFKKDRTTQSIISFCRNTLQ
jgi:hypothetical protein